jgi:hypothetical protein
MIDKEREIGTTGEILQVDDDWQIEDHENDNGPVILHVKCGTYLCDLNRKYPMCRSTGCGARVPPSMISGFTMMNWDKADDSEYFVPLCSEVKDFIYNGYLHMELRKLPNHPIITEDQIATAIEG